MIQVNHHFAPDGPTAAAMGLKAGCDTDCGGVYGGNAITAVNRSILRHALDGMHATHALPTLLAPHTSLTLLALHASHASHTSGAHQ